MKHSESCLSSFPEDGSPLVLYGDFNIHFEKPHATDFLSLLSSFDLLRLNTTGTHKSGNQLNLIFTCSCITNNISVNSLHASDCFIMTFNLHLPSSAPPSPLLRQYLAYFLQVSTCYSLEPLVNSGLKTQSSREKMAQVKRFS